jgi:SPP1 gp7 family putative phage head morphogenesis protein
MFDLEKPFTDGSSVKEEDARAMKIALNHLGYYTPNPKMGITAIPDRAVFTALKAFQKDHGLQASATAKPHDKTVEALNDETEKQDSSNGQYVWRTVQDDHVRTSHRQRDGQTFSWNAPPEGGHPGEDYNCRCWAVPVKEVAEGLTQTVTSAAEDAKDKWDNFQFLWHFAFGGGRTVTLHEIGYLGDVIAKAKETIFKRVEDQVAEKMRQIKSGFLVYETEGSYSFADVHPYFGGGTVRTRTEGMVTRKDNVLSIDATVQYEYEDTFTDPENIRQEKYGTSSPEGVSEFELKVTDRGGTYYKIVGEWATHLTGSINAK